MSGPAQGQQMHELETQKWTLGSEALTPWIEGKGRQNVFWAVANLCRLNRIVRALSSSALRRILKGCGCAGP
eukprot:418702-Pelagomonas_calceolata.AAC.4